MTQIPPSLPSAASSRRLRQWLLSSVLIVTVSLGWKYPWLGFSVPLAMIAGITGGLVRGRYVCGNLCPRGSFFDRFIATIAPGSTIPASLRRMPLRWGIFTLLTSFLIWRLVDGPVELNHWGVVFWSVCAITTAVGVVLAFTIHPRAWCALCPVGTLSNVIGGSRYRLAIDSSCRECGRCEQSCTFDLKIVRHKAAGVFEERDCLKCSACVEACPVGALKWPEKQDPLCMPHPNSHETT